MLSLDDEFPNQLYVSAVLGRFGARLRTVPWSRFYDSVNDRTRMAVLSTVNYATGFRPPMEEISRFLRERGVLLYVDGTQSVGALQFDIARVRPAVLCVDAYKWLLSPNGAGFLYVDPELRERLAGDNRRLAQRSRLAVGQFAESRRPGLLHAAEKYEGGMLPFPSIYGMGAVIDMMLEIGPAAIEARVLELAGKARAMLRGLGADVNRTSRRS